MERPEGILNEIGLFLHFFPVAYVKEIMLPSMNENITEAGTFDEFLCFLGLFYSMEVQHLPEHRMYCDAKDSQIFKLFGYGEYMSKFRFEEIISGLAFSAAGDKDIRILDLDAINNKCQAALKPGDFLCLDESMVKAFHMHVKEKIFFLNWDSLYARLNSHYEAWSYKKKKHKKIKAYMKSV